VWVTTRVDVLFKSLNVTKTINIFLARFRFLKKPQIFLMPLGIVHAAPPLPKSPLISSVELALHPQHEMSCNSEIQTKEDLKRKFRKQPGRLSIIALNSKDKEKALECQC